MPIDSSGCGGPARGTGQESTKYRPGATFLGPVPFFAFFCAALIACRSYPGKDKVALSRLFFMNWTENLKIPIPETNHLLGILVF
jgi:hypothetical protein